MTDLITRPTLSDNDVQEALDIARRMIEAGIPVFAAPPCRPGCAFDTHPAGKFHYHLPKHWQATVPAMVNLEKWRPGWALAAIGGFAADFLDVDPRSGGDATADQWRSAGHWPRTFGRQQTPSGGYHEIITPTGQRKIVLAPGVDLQSGVAETRDGLGLVYIAPTVGVSKVTGELLPYRWETPPDLSALREWHGCDDSTAHVITVVQAKRAAPPVPAQRAAEPATPDLEDPFATNASMSTGPASGERSFTPEEAKNYLRPYLLRLREAQIGMIEETANVTATALSHFIPAFWSVDQAYSLLTEALSHTAYDPTHQAATWKAEKFRAVLDGRRPPIDNWKATRKPEPPAPPSMAVEAAPGEESLTTIQRLRKMMLDGPDMANRPNPVPLIQDLLDMDSDSWIIGAPGCLKSFIVLDWAGHVGAGKDWQGHRVRKGKVLYIAAEGVKGMVLRARAWQKIHGPMVGVTFLPYPVKIQSHDGQWDALVRIVQEDGYDFVIIDTQARVSVGLEENAASGIAFLTEAVSAIRRASGACVLVVHHTGRNGQDARGSNAIDAAQDTELKVVRAEPKWVNVGGEAITQCKILHDKQKDMMEDESGIQLRLKVVDLGTDPDTGRDLSSLVVCGQEDNPFASAQGVDLVDVEPWRGRQPEPWTGKPVPSQAKVKRRILQALADHAGLTGLTEATVKRVVKDRWEEPSATGWTDAWQAVKDLDGLVVNVGGERWAIDHTAMEGLKAEA